MMPWMFYFRWTKLLVIREMHYSTIIMQAMVVEMLWNIYVIIFSLCCCGLISIAVVLAWWVMSYSLGYFQPLCMEISWMYKEITGKESYTREGYSKGSDGGYGGVGHSGGAYTGGDSLDIGGYTSDDIYGGHVGTVYIQDIVQVTVEVMLQVMNFQVVDMTQVDIRYIDQDMKRKYANQGYDKRLLWTRYKRELKETKGNEMIKRGGYYLLKVSYRKEDELYKIWW